HFNHAGTNPSGIYGDVNNNGDVGVSDVVYLINYLFRDGVLPPVPNQADINADCDVSVSDVVYFIAHLFKSGPLPQPGCVE
ncbi:MAG: dockerin type I repeat-containing protein, partial [candidate division Zixibacteria bacterium]|nr:dockerin type I repeat-containing protein [candidate division Zixibacteria bacterium]